MEDVYIDRVNSFGGVFIKKERVNNTTYITFSIDGVIFKRSGGNLIRFCDRFLSAIEYLENNGCKYIKVLDKDSLNFPIMQIIDTNGYEGSIKCAYCKQYVSTNKKISRLCKENKHIINSFCENTNSDILIDFNCEHKPRYIKASYYINNSNCRVCINADVEKGVNDIASTNQEVVKYFKNKDDAYRYSYGSGEKVCFKCPCCGLEVERCINTVTALGFSCPICNDTLSMGEKLMYSFLLNNNINFEMHKTFEWSNRKEYDFYLIDFNTIIEVHGLQHYGKTFERLGGRTLKEEQMNDKLKEKLAYKNGIKKYIVIDARLSDLNFIKENIIKSQLIELLDLHSVDWNDICKTSLDSLVEKVWNMRFKNPYMTTSEIEKVVKINRDTVRKWLKLGNDLGKCSYDAEKEASYIIERNGNSCKKTVIVYKDETNLGEYESASFIQANSIELFKVFLYSSEIYRVCNGVKESYKGFKFKYKEDCKYVLSCNYKNSKRVALYKNGELMKIYNSCQELARLSFEDFGVKLQAGKISEVCNGKRIQHKGFTSVYL